MDLVALLVILAAIGAVVALVASPLRSGNGARMRDERGDRIAELEARKEAKYREIRDAELDLRTGKLSTADHRALDRQLRADAVEILQELDEARG